VVWRHGALVSTVVGELLEPILYLFGMGYGFGHFVREVEGLSYMAFVAPGLLAMGAMYTASFEGTFNAFTRIDRQKTYDAMVVTPVDLEDVVMGDILWAGTKAGIGSVMVVLVASTIGVVEGPLALLCIPHGFLIGLCFGALSLIMSALARNYEFFTYYFTLGITPMLLTSGAWYPLDGLPPDLARLAWLNPLLHAVVPARDLMSGRVDGGTALSLLVLLGFTFAFSLGAMALIRRRLVN